jgi:V-type H+-transporting ATPase subunit C
MPAWWIVSGPAARSSKDQIFRQTQQICKSEDSQAYDFRIPTLKVKNLSSLMNLTDDMSKYEERTEATLKRLHRNYEDLNPESPLDVNKVTPERYLQRFEWDVRKYPEQTDLAKLAGDIYNEISDMDNDIKSKQGELSAINSRLNNIQRKRSGNLMTRDLSDIIRVDHYVQDPVTKKLSQKIVPYFIVVSAHRVPDFLNCYERFTEFVVPRSAKEVKTADQDYKLFRILHLNAPALEDNLKNACEQHKFVFRNFKFEPQQAQETSAEEAELEQEQKRLTQQVIMYIKSNFSEMFVAFMHLKAIRVFVESVLWYSLPPNFQVMLIQPNESRSQNLRAKLATQFQNAKCSQGNMSKGDDEDNHPYVSMDLDLEWLLGEE